MKICSRCGENKDLSCFNKKTGSKDGKHPICRHCCSVLNRIRFVEKREYICRKAREYRASHPKTYDQKLKKLAGVKRYFQKNPGKRNFFRTMYYMQKRKAYMSWADKGKISALYQLAKVYNNAGIPCHVDHIYPLKGENVCGLHVENNLQLLLEQENRKKHNKVQSGC